MHLSVVLVLQTSACILAYSPGPFQSVTPLPSPTGSSNSRRILTRHGKELWSCTDDEDFQSGDWFDIEYARQKLESMVGISSDNTQKHGGNENSHDLLSMTIFSNSLTPMTDLKELPPPPAMTSIKRERKEAEIQFIRELEDGDESLTKIMDLWFNEEGSLAAAKFRRAIDLLHDTSSGGLDEPEALLYQLIEMYGIHWAEPVNRLASLYYIRGKLDVAKAMWIIVLAVKPWHFGALSGLVKVYADLGDADNARHWASRRLPTYAPIGTNKRRREWVEQSIKQAQSKLDQAEKLLLQSFGEKDHYAKGLQNRLQHYDSNIDDNWQ